MDEVDEAVVEFEDEFVVTDDFDGLDEVDEVVVEFDRLDEVDGLPEEETDLQLTHPDKTTAQIHIANIFFIIIIIPFCKRHNARWSVLSTSHDEFLIKSVQASCVTVGTGGVMTLTNSFNDSVNRVV